MGTAVRVLLVGASGRLGQAISRIAETDPGVTIVARCGRGDPIAPIIDQCDAVIDVSTAAAGEEICAACVAHHKPLVIGTTGHSAEQTDRIGAAARTIPIVLAPHFRLRVSTALWVGLKTAGV